MTWLFEPIDDMIEEIWFSMRVIFGIASSTLGAEMENVTYMSRLIFETP